MNKVKIELTEDQQRYLIGLVNKNYREIEKQPAARWKSKALAFNKRLHTTLAKAKS